MSYEVTATRKRPQGFETLVGQEFVVSTLSNAIASERIAHAYLFSGPRGVGKTSAARLLAKALNCEQGPTPRPCGECSNCKEISRGNSLDVIEIDGASNTSVNDVREIKDEVLFAPGSGRYKVYIIDEVHMLSNSAFNALLKTIEEPPPYIVFIFATTEIHKVPATIKSRCQQFSFRLIAPELIKEKLVEAAAEMEVQAEGEALFWIAKEATGSLRDAYTLFDQVASFSKSGITLEEIRKKLGLVGLERINSVADALAAEDAGRAIELAESILADGVAVEQFIIDLAEYFRNLLFMHHGIKKEAVLGYSPERFSSEARSCWSINQLETAIELLLRLYREIRYSLNQRFELELLLSRLAGMKSYLSPREILQEIDGLRNELIRGDLPLHGKDGGAGGAAGAGDAGSDVGADVGAASGAIPEEGSDAYANGEEAWDGEDDYSYQGTSAEDKDSAASDLAAAPVLTKEGSSKEGSSVPSGTVSSGAVPATSSDTASVPGASAGKASVPGSAPGVAVSGAVPSPSGPRMLSDSEVEQITGSLRKTKPALVSALEKTESWYLKDGSLILSFESGFTVNFLRGEVQTISEILLPVIGIRPEVKLKVISDKTREEPEKSDEEIRLVKDIFRGEIVGTEGRN